MGRIVIDTEGDEPGYLNVGLMKPRVGLTVVAGKKKLGVGEVRLGIDRGEDLR